MENFLVLSDDDRYMIALVGCSLDRSPGKNWVENSGSLPDYICRIARAIHRSGHPISQSIAIAVSRVKKWAAGLDDVDADTRAKAAAAVAQWEALKAKNKAKTVAKKAGNAAKGDGGRDRDRVRATGETMTDLDRIIALAARQEAPHSDLDTILRLAGKNPFAKGGAISGDGKKPNPFAKGGDSGSGKKAPPFGKKSGGDGGGGDSKSGGGLTSAAAVKAAWARLKANKDLTPEQYAAQASRIKAAAKKFNVELG